MVLRPVASLACGSKVLLKIYGYQELECRSFCPNCGY